MVHFLEYPEVVRNFHVYFTMIREAPYAFESRLIQPDAVQPDAGKNGRAMGREVCGNGPSLNAGTLHYPIHAGDDTTSHSGHRRSWIYRCAYSKISVAVRPGTGSVGYPQRGS